MKAALIRRTGMPPRLRTMVAAAALSLVACASCKRAPDDEGVSSTKPRKKPLQATASPKTAGPPPAMPGCEEDNRQIYVVSLENDLYRFPPLKKTFTKLGTLDCPAGTATPFSMAVDRMGVAWILYNDGHLYKASTRDATCSSTSFVPRQHGVDLFGMAFVADAPGSSHDTLYVADDGHTSLGVSKLDPTTLTLTAPVPFDGTNGRFDLTGTGDGHVFGFDAHPPARLVEIDPATGKITREKSLGTLSGESAWAVSQYWGSFYIFSAAFGAHSQVTRFEWSTGKSEIISADVGFTIVGAGVSSCAPSGLQ
jgi:hypothetical protein